MNDLSQESKRLTVKLLNDSPPNSTIFCLGSTGSGKTTLTANLLLDVPRFIIFDTRNEYNKEFFEPSNLQLATAETPSQFVHLLNAGVPRIIVETWKTTEAEWLVSQCLLCLQQFQLQNFPALGEVTVALDELNRFVESEYIDGLADIVHRGRAIGIKKIFGAQWFGTIPAWIRDSLTELYVFRHTDTTGLERLAKLGFDTEQVSTLSPFCAVHLGKNGFELVELVPATDNKLKTKRVKRGAES